MVIKPVRRLFWDIETSFNIVGAFRAGYDINISHDAIISERKIICIAFKWEGSRKVTVLRWDKHQNDKGMLRTFLEVAKTADELVAHYGDRFDKPWFATRCLLLGFEPIPPFKTVDTKAWASKYFYFNSNKLDYLSKVLGFGGKLKTDFDLWKDVILYKKKSALDKMCRYCGVDVIRLEQVYHKIKFCVKPKTHAGVMAGLDKWTCPYDGSTRVVKTKTRVTAAGTIQHQMQCLECGGYYTISQSAYEDYIEAKKEKQTHLPKIRRTPKKRNRQGHAHRIQTKVNGSR